MSFFGFDTNLPKDRGHPTAAPGFGQAPDPFGDLQKPQYQDDDEDAWV